MAQASDNTAEPAVAANPATDAGRADAAEPGAAAASMDQGGAVGAAPSPFPAYLHSLLQIQVPLSVTLVSKRQPLQRILELGPGSILPFDKSCTEPLTLEVAGESIAQGEVVKVGDKFGLRLTSLVLPDARLRAVEGRKKPTP
jgi:flagellar motor switch/type III secretory pathway protein FliN